MTSARDEILERIQRALANRSSHRSQEYSSIARDYVQSGPWSHAETLDLFESRLRDYEAGTYRSSNSGIPAVLAHVLAQRSRQSMLITESVSQAWLPEGFEFICDQQLTYLELDRAPGILTTCALAIASTGTIVLRHTPESGRRAATLIPDYHLCMVCADQVVHTVPEGIKKMATFSKDPLTTISGPSATSDIEMTRVKGVHGPRTLDVIVICDETMPRRGENR
jgi:L-lactate dehydrogenase complex protein LldG